MKWIAIKILKHQMKKTSKKIDKYNKANDSIFARAFSDANKSYKDAIMFLEADR